MQSLPILHVQTFKKKWDNNVVCESFHSRLGGISFKEGQDPLSVRKSLILQHFIPTICGMTVLILPLSYKLCNLFGNKHRKQWNNSITASLALELMPLLVKRQEDNGMCCFNCKKNGLLKQKIRSDGLNY